MPQCKNEKKNTGNRASNTQLGMKINGTQTSFRTNIGGKLKFILSFFFLSATYISTTPKSRTTIITLEPCALNAEFQHFILRLNKISLLCRYHLKSR
jgi:hypothetical protein